MKGFLYAYGQDGLHFSSTEVRWILVAFFVISSGSAACHGPSTAFFRGEEYIIIDLEATPDDKKDMEIGTDENPESLVDFFPVQTRQLITAINIPGRNDPCHCSS